VICVLGFLSRGSGYMTIFSASGIAVGIHPKVDSSFAVNYMRQIDLLTEWTILG
jgi:hypothetical protein